jgi:Fe-S cluster assembly protein SufD
MRFKSNNILLSDKATINAKPQLEIFADDKMFAWLHHWTTRRNSYVYMQQREFRKKPTYAFSNAVKHQNTRLKQRITKLIATKLGVKIVDL